MRRSFRRAARTEIQEAANWYEEQKEGLGDSFLEALEEALAKIEGSPQLYPRIRYDLRRARFPRPFPHLVFYRVRGDVLEIVAVFHPARNPEVWHRR